MASSGDGWPVVARHPSAWPGPGSLRLLAGEGDVTGATFVGVQCPICFADDDKVVDSRLADAGAAVRRRRECLGCGHRFTTFERCEEQPLVVVKRSGDRVPFDRAKIVEGVLAAAKGRPIDLDEADEVAGGIEDEVRAAGRVVASEQVGLAVLERLRELDQVAYVRFASVYKGFDDPADFEREIGLLTKTTAPKRR